MRRLTNDEVRVRLSTSPQRVYDLVSDVTRIPEWSPEVVGCEWLDGATGPEAGARFRARNRRRWFRWSNNPVVDVADAPREFAVTRTEPGGGSIRWTYRIAPDGDGAVVALRYDVLKPVPVGLHVVLRVLFGVRELHDDLHANMCTSLDRIADIVGAIATVPDDGAQAR